MSDNPMTINSEDGDASVSVSPQKPSDLDSHKDNQEIPNLQEPIPDPPESKEQPETPKNPALPPDHEKSPEKNAPCERIAGGSEGEEPEVGIVGPASAAGDVLNDEELLDAPVKDSVAEWIEKSAKENDMSNNGGKNGAKDGVSLPPTRKSQRIVTNIIKRSIKCLNKMHAMDCATSSPSSGKPEKREDESRRSPKVPQNRQNGAALPEETATPTVVKKENQSDDETTDTRKKTRSKERKRKSTEDPFSNFNPKRICFEQRERFIDSLVGCDRISAEELATRADELRAEVQALDELARAKEMEWNEILSMRKLKEEAYLRVERKRQVMGFLGNTNGQIAESIPPASLSLAPDWEPPAPPQEPPAPTEAPKDSPPPEEPPPPVKKSPERQIIPPKSQNRQLTVSQVSARPPQDQKHQKRILDVQLDARQIGEGRQGPLLDVRSVIAEHRLRHPETVPRRGRRMRNSVNIGLAAGGGFVETIHDSRPSSTDSCKSGSNPDVNYKDIHLQFAKFARQQSESSGTSVKNPQNYPDVTLHPVASGPVTGTTGGQSGSLLHGILTKSHSPRPTTFSPTLAKLLTAPERERGQVQVAQMVQGFQGNSGVSISDLLSSSKARREITITPVGNTPIQSSHSNNVIHVEDVEEDNSLIEERDSRRTSSRENREDRDTPPRCQGCQERAAQFVCAGCGNQWYCSRECQVSAWDEHSEVCSG
ncbi:uncharacterized protein LOC107037544 isoform X2 [Diachasma alloeum]|uniref:uncharacterized protein LOC107037544 isoform X2 n=1 Tax=Diachasma alloeum TaxID=454923 RepID=UPI0007383159|nr:uncharacterized protein LOC107037544 isoform X2 [Diachasma alloeum]XP_015111643.1 uncharacterized protein LOC107037544 isoform X2 [Diachasma alloeum]